MKVKFFTNIANTVFWRGNPKAGALLGVLLAVFVVTVWVPAIFAAILATQVADCGCGFSHSPNERLLKGMFFTGCGAMVYAALLWLCFAWDVARKLFKARFRIPRGMQAKTWRGVGCMAAGLALTVLAVFWVLGDWQRYALFSMVLFLACAGWIFGLYVLPWHKRAGWWVFLPLVFVALTQWVPLAILPLQNKPLERAFAEMTEAADVPFSWDAFMAIHTNGVSLKEEPYATLFSETEEFPNPYEVFPERSLPMRPTTEKERLAFAAFEEKHARIIALVDALTAGPIPRVANEAAFVFLPEYGGLNNVARWPRLYALRMVLAAEDKDVAGMMEAYRRIQRIQAYAEAQSPMFHGVMIGLSAEASENTALSRVVTLLPDEMLEALQTEVVRDEQEIMARLKTACVFQCGVAVRATCHTDWRRRVSQKYSEPPVLPIMAHMAPFEFVRDKHCLAKKLARLPVVFDEILLSPETLKKFSRELRRLAEGYGEGMIQLFNEGAPFNCMAEMVEFRMRGIERGRLLATAIAVERFRRATGALPERLEELVPDYLAAVPLSLEDGEPVSYEHGEVKPHKHATFVVDGFSVAGSWYKEWSSTNRTSVVVGKERSTGF